MTCEDRVVFDSPQWAGYSKECQDLIFKLLIKTPEDRITLDQAMAHSWFNSVRNKFDLGGSTSRSHHLGLANLSGSPQRAKRGAH